MVETLRIEPRARISHCDQHALRVIFPEPTCSSRGPSPTPLIASMALMIRLRITCCNWIRSPRMSGRSSR